MKVLWVPIFSMRSYETGKYAVLKDGNFQLTLARVLASHFDDITIAIPDQVSDMDELEARMKQLLGQRDSKSRIWFQHFKYGANAVETREMFWKENGHHAFDYDLLITDITGYVGPTPMICNFNITKLPELDRPYIDKFFEQDLKSIERSLFTTVLNPRQREYILEVRPDLIDRVIVHTKCAHELLLPKWSVFMDSTDKVIFWPFRLSDKAYKWTEFLQSFEDHGLPQQGYSILVTDPNESSKELPAYVTKIKPSKEDYYRLLSARPLVVMLDDIDTVLHPGTIEFFHYGCPVITFEAKLINNPNSIQNLTELGYAINNLVYDIQPNMNRFVYGETESDPYYNETFINVRKN